jgi:hypothetical protein
MAPTSMLFRCAVRRPGHPAAQRLAVHDHASMGPQIEMADPQLLVDGDDQPCTSGFRGGDFHVEGAGQMQRFDLVHQVKEADSRSISPGRSSPRLRRNAERPVVGGRNILHHRSGLFRDRLCLRGGTCRLDPCFCFVVTQAGRS